MKSVPFLIITSILVIGCTSTVQQDQLKVSEDVQVTTSDSTRRMSIEKKSLFIEVSPEQGGRISSLKLNGQEVLSLEDIHPTNWGSTFWVSPQSKWGWPPPVAFDSLPYAATKTEDDKIILQGAIDKQKTGTSISKTISMDDNGKFIEIEYEIKNETDSTITVAPWEITRVPVNGLSFYSADPDSYTSPFDVVDTNGCVWFDYSNSQIQEGHAKLIGSANEGWLAHLNGSILFVKIFPHNDAFNAAPNEGEIEIYANPDKIYIELEPQGELMEIQSGEVGTWKVKWIVRLIRKDMNVSVGSSELVNYVKSLVK